MADQDILIIPWNTKAVAFRLAVYAVTLTCLLLAALRLNEWGEAGWVVAAAGAVLLMRAVRLRDIARQGPHCLELGPEHIRLNCLRPPVTVRWDSVHSCEAAATHTLLRSDSLLLLLYEDRLPTGMDPGLARPFPRVPGTRALRIDCTFAAMDQKALLAEITSRIEAAR